MKEHKDGALFGSMRLKFEEKVSVNHGGLHVELNLMIFKSQDSSGPASNIRLSLVSDLRVRRLAS